VAKPGGVLGSEMAGCCGVGRLVSATCMRDKAERACPAAVSKSFALLADGAGLGLLPVKK
jgi:hypothetical protein